KSSNNFSVLGINLQLEGVSTNPITINVSSDVESVYEKIKSFIDEYNKIIDDITEQINQKFYKDYHPLSNEEKQAMKDRDIELWEEKAKSGLVQNDPTLTRMLQTLRSRLYEKVEGVGGSFDHITQIGITTGRYQDGGKLVIDEQKLKNAINNDPEGVLELLFKTPEGSDENDEKVKNSGLVNRIYDTMVDSMKEIISKSGPGEDAALLRNVRSNILIDFVTEQSSISLLDKDIEKLNQRIIREERILAQREDSYWKRFTAMEKAMAAMQQQSMWLMSQMGFY
ncbi:MAG: flagellar filament capping protein FliD, partial [Clostridiales bacterium]|nr:flagellar filament capping protein FliD [Clostridiales bacterium]